MGSTSRSRFYSPIVVHSMDIASAVGGEFTGDGIMVVLGGRP
jgi:hypothetical protein